MAHSVAFTLRSPSAPSSHNFTLAQPGERIGRYLIERRIGAGGMGEVFRARDTALDRVVALKLLHPGIQVVQRETMSPSVVREAKAAAAIQHPSVVAIYDVGEHEGLPYLAMEYLDGQTLREVVRGGALPLDRALSILSQVADALNAAHGKGDGARCGSRGRHCR